MSYKSMIQQQTVVKVMDNSGGITARCIKVLGGLRKKTAKFGQKIVISIQKVKKDRKNKIYTIKKGNIYKALITQTKKSHRRKDGSFIKFNSNSVCLLKNNMPAFTRVIGFTLKELKHTKYSKITDIAAGTL